jgi:hypothetical protein
VSEWGRATFGDPCRECGFDWSLRLEDAAAIVGDVPRQFAELLAGSNGRRQHRELSWSAGAYVRHVVDNLRIWAERLAGAALGAHGPVAPYDENLLARARNYHDIPVEGAVWSLGRAAADWRESLSLAVARNVVLHHPERGDQSVLDVARTNAHDAYHHGWDIGRSMG